MGWKRHLTEDDFQSGPALPTVVAALEGRYFFQTADGGETGTLYRQSPTAWVVVGGDDLPFAKLAQEPLAALDNRITDANLGDINARALLLDSTGDGTKSLRDDGTYATVPSPGAGGGGGGFKFTFTDSVGAVGTGEFGFDNAVLGSVTELRISSVDADGLEICFNKDVGFYEYVGYITVTQASDPTKKLRWEVNNPSGEAGSPDYVRFLLDTNTSTSTTWTQPSVGDELYVEFDSNVRGDTFTEADLNIVSGAMGTWLYDAGAGTGVGEQKFSFDNLDLTLVTELYVHKTSTAAGTANVELDLVSAWSRGAIIYLGNIRNNEESLSAKIASVTDNTTYVTVAFEADSVSFGADLVWPGNRYFSIVATGGVELTAGSGIIIAGDAVSTNDAAIDHNALLNFTAFEHGRFFFDVASKRDATPPYTDFIADFGVGAPQAGDLYLESDNLALYVFSSTWQPVVTEQGGGNITHAAGAPGAGANGDFYYDTTNQKFYFFDVSEWELVNGTADLHKTLTYDLPQAGDVIPIWYTDKDIEITSVRGVAQGSTPSITGIFRYDPSLAATGTVALSQVTNSTTTGVLTPSSGDFGLVDAGNWIWLDVSSVSGTVDTISYVIKYTEAV